jgi:Tfp pilus assembly protein PilF
MSSRILRALFPHSRRGRLVATALILLLAGLGAWGGWHYRTESVLHDAERALDRHDYDEASRLLAEYLRARPDAGRGHLLAARAARCARRYDEAEEHLRVCQRLHHDADAVSLERVLADVQRGNLRAEKHLWSRVEAGDAHTLAILEVLTEEYVRTYRLGQALDCLKLYLEKKPDDLLALLGRAHVYERLLYFAEATDDYRRAVALYPDDDTARLRFAENLLIVGPPSEALRQFETLRGRRGDTPTILLGLAKGHRQLGHTDEARRLLDTLLADHRDQAAGLAERGKVALEQGQVDEAVAFLRRAVEAAPCDREAHNNLAVALRRQGDREGAAKELARADEIDADLRRLDRVTKAVIKNPNDAALRCEGGILYLRNGEEQEGVRWLTFALQIDPGCVAAHRALAGYYRKSGQAELAERHERLAQPTDGASRVPPG